ncbi:MAG: methyltransferase domain-containing protein [Planctomycetota bacterium]
MSENQTIRDKVSVAYTEAIETKGGCCAPSDAPGVPSFGCGNPLAFGDVQPGETVLDLGSGAGHDLLAAAEAAGPDGKVIGVDMTDAMLEAAREFTRGHENIELRKGIIEEMPVEDASVDWVISNCVINLSPEKDRVFGEIFRVLRPGGRFSISDIVAENMPEHLKNDDKAYSACVSGAIPEAEYLAGLRDTGLVDVEVAERFPFDACGTDVAGLDIASVRVTGRRP